MTSCSIATATNLVLTLKNSTDRITVSSYFSQDATSNYRLEVWANPLRRSARS
ncbi:calcium-binding protein [Pseudomonas aeruginosa]|uniref:calcium-binding protein n=1 Tax=Pseudomonas aeruginosa TaxID=287 RepID=UPI0025814DAD|nr:hypothetical protein [Pseudomonas aeruginosa]